MEFKCIAIDDEPLALKKLASFVSKVKDLKLVKTFDNALEAIPFLKNEVVDLIFLDIQMENFTGIQLLESLKTYPQVIITSAFEEYALKGFDLNVTDYLLKPYSFERFVQALNKAIDSSKEKKTNNSELTKDFIFVKTEYRLEKLLLDDILYVEGMSNYLRIVTKTKKIMVLQSFKYLEDRLTSPTFFRVHKSFLVSVKNINNIEKNIIKINDKHIPIGITYRKAFYDFIESKLTSTDNPN